MDDPKAGVRGSHVTLAYLAGACLIVVPTAHRLIALWPARPAQIVWRLGAGAEFASALPYVTLGILCIAAAAVSGPRRRVPRRVAVGAAVVALVSLASAAVVAMDALTIRVLPAGEQRAAALVSTGYAIATQVALAVALGSIVFVSLRVGRGRGGAKEKKEPMPIAAKPLESSET